MISNIDYLKFFAIGDVYELDHQIDVERIVEYCESQQFEQRDKNINTLSLTSIDGSLNTTVSGGLKYIDNLKDKDIRSHTIHYEMLAQYSSLLRDFKSDMGRTRIFRSDPCGVWEPHRDGSSVIRIIIPLKNCDNKNFRLMYENRVMHLEQGRAYVVNTMKEHAAVCFTLPAYVMVICIDTSPSVETKLQKCLTIK